MIRTSEGVAAISAAIVKAQAEMPAAPKDTKGQVGNQTRFYADLGAVVDAARPVLAAHGLAFAQFPSDYANGSVVVTTRLLHESGEWMESDLPMPTGGNGAQGVGSAITYAKRYALMAVLGMASEDDDGGAASKPAKKAAQPPPPGLRQPNSVGEPTSPRKGATEAQITRLQILLGEAGIKLRDEKLDYCAGIIRREVATSKDMTPVECGSVIAALEELIARQDDRGAS